MYRIVWWVTTTIFIVYTAIAGSKDFWPGISTVVDSLLEWSYPYMQTILICSGIGQLFAGIAMNKVAAHENRTKLWDMEDRASDLIDGIIGDQIVRSKEQLWDGGSDHDLKITVFMKCGDRLIPIRRAGGVDGVECRHTFPTSGMYPGVAGRAFQQGIAVSIYDLPDLHNLPSGRRERNRILAEYAAQTFQRQSDVEEELLHKTEHGRHMPRAFRAARIASGTGQRKLGVVVVDMAHSPLARNKEDDVANLAIILEPLLRRLSHDRIRRQHDLCRSRHQEDLS